MIESDPAAPAATRSGRPIWEPPSLAEFKLGELMRAGLWSSRAATIPSPPPVTPRGQTVAKVHISMEFYAGAYVP